MAQRDIAAQVAALDRRFRRACQAGERLGRERVEQRIAPGLGVVVLDVWGNLVEVRLDRAGLRVADPRTVDRQVLSAIHAAEARAARMVDEHARRWA